MPLLLYGVTQKYINIATYFRLLRKQYQPFISIFSQSKIHGLQTLAKSERVVGQKPFPLIGVKNVQLTEDSIFNCAIGPLHSGGR